MRSLLSYYILGGDSDISGMQCGPCSLTIFLAVTAISVACNDAMRALLSYYVLGGYSDISGMQRGPCSLTIFLAVTAISVACNAVLALLLYSWRRQRYQWHATRSLLSYYILGGDSDISGMQRGPCSLTIFLAATAISVACNAVLALLLYSWRRQRYQWHA